jgi:hypothetical protein
VNSSPNNSIVEAVVEISQRATGHQVTHVADDRSLWDKAYDSLKTEEHDRIAAYEDLLSRVPIGGRPWLVLDPKLRQLTRDSTGDCSNGLA